MQEFPQIVTKLWKLASVYRRRNNQMCLKPESDMTQLKVLFCVFLFLVYSKAELKCEKNEELDNCPVTCDYDFCPKNNVEPKPCARKKPCSLPECKCIFNYRRAENGTCIPTTACPPFPCNNPNEEFNACPPYCPTDSCSQASEDAECPFPGYFMTVFCNPTCRCKKGHWRKNGVCIPYRQCFEPIHKSSAPS